MMELLQAYVDDPSNIGKEYAAANGKTFKVSKTDNFGYLDPIDQSIAKNQVRVHQIIFWKEVSKVQFFRGSEFSSRMALESCSDYLAPEVLVQRCVKIHEMHSKHDDNIIIQKI